MNVKHLGLIALTAVVAAGLAGMSTSSAGAAVAAAPANCVIRTWTGNYVTAVGGGGRELDTLHTNATQIGSWERFALVPAGNGMVAIQTVDGHYLTALSGGGLTDDMPGTSAIHTDATRIQAWEEFTLVPLNNGKPFGYAIRTINGHYLTAVEGGGQTTTPQGHIIMDTIATSVNNWEQFQVICGL
jgi:hypothetical protein